MLLLLLLLLLLVFLFQFLFFFDQSVQILPKQSILIFGSPEMLVGNCVPLPQ